MPVSVAELVERARLFPATLKGALGIPDEVLHSLRWDIGAGAFTGMYMGITFPFFTKIARDGLHAAPEAIALMAASPFIGNLFSPLWARQMEGRDKLPFCVGSWLLARSALFIMPLAMMGNVFVGLVVALQLIATVSSPAYASLMRDIYPDHARGRLMGYVRVMSQTMTFIATLLAGRLMDHGISFHILFPMAAVVGLLGAWCFSKVRPLPNLVTHVAAPSSGGAFGFLRDTLAILKHNVPYRYFALSVFVYGFANLMVQPLYQLYQVDVLKVTSTSIANLTNVSSLFAIAGAFFWGRFMDRYGPPMTVMAGIVLIGLIPVVYLTANAIWVLYFAAALSGFGSAGIELSYLASILLYAEPGRAAQYQSLHSLLLGIRGVIASLIGVTLMKIFGFAAVFAGAILVMLCGAMLQWLAIHAARKNSEEAEAG